MFQANNPNANALASNANAPAPDAAKSEEIALLKHEIFELKKLLPAEYKIIDDLTFKASEGEGFSAGSSCKIYPGSKYEIKIDGKITNAVLILRGALKVHQDRSINRGCIRFFTAHIFSSRLAVLKIDSQNIDIYDLKKLNEHETLTECSLRFITVRNPVQSSYGKPRVLQLEEYLTTLLSVKSFA